MIDAILQSQSFRHILLLLFLLILIPSLFSFYNTRREVQLYNVCFVGPASPHPPTSLSTSSSSSSSSAEEMEYYENIADLYGTYRSYDGASYYYVKTPFDVLPTCLRKSETLGCGWPSATSLATTLSPRGIRMARESWIAKKEQLLNGRRHDESEALPLLHSETTATTKGEEEEESMTNEEQPPPSSSSSSANKKVTATITWDQGPNPFSSGQSRWCLLSQYLPNDQTRSPLPKIKICTHLVPSIMSDSKAEPYFPELPLRPPPDGIWEDIAALAGGGLGSQQQQQQQQTSAFSTVMNFPYSNYNEPPPQQQQQQQPPAGYFGNNENNNRPNYKVKVSCFMNQKTISTSARGQVLHSPNDEQRANAAQQTFTTNHNWDLWDLPGTFFLLLFQIFLFLRLRTIYMTNDVTKVAVTYENIVEEKEIQRIMMGPFTHVDVGHLVFNLYGTYMVGAALEGDYGTLPYLYLTWAMGLLSCVGSLGVVYFGRMHGNGKFGRIIAFCLGGMRVSSSSSNSSNASISSASTVSTSASIFDPNALVRKILVMGYTPILLSWLVVLSLERHYIYPFPFIDVNFPTLELLPRFFLELGFSIRVNAVPFAVLLLSKLVIPSNNGSSGKEKERNLIFVSHMVGMVIGFLVHWNVPPNLLLVPQLLIPGLLWVYLRFVKRVIPIRRQFSGGAKGENLKNEEEVLEGGTVKAWWNGNMMTNRRSRGPYERVAELEEEDGEASSKGNHSLNTEEIEENERRKAKTSEKIFLPLLLVILIGITIYSLGGFDHGMALSQFISTVLFFHVVQSRFTPIVATSTNAAATSTTSASLYNNGYNDDDQYFTNGNDNHSIGSFGSNGSNSMANASVGSNSHKSNLPYGEDTPGINSKENQMLLLKTYFLSCAILIRTDAMALGTWFVTHVFVTSDSDVYIEFWEALVSVGVRMFFNLVGLVVISGLLAIEKYDQEQMTTKQQQQKQQHGKKASDKDAHDYNNEWTDVFGLVYRYASTLGVDFLCLDWFCLSCYRSLLTHCRGGWRNVVKGGEKDDDNSSVLSG